MVRKVILYESPAGYHTSNGWGMGGCPTSKAFSPDAYDSLQFTTEGGPANSYGVQRSALGLRLRVGASTVTCQYYNS